MVHEPSVEVLVLGAGPAGVGAALAAAAAGASVGLVDGAERAGGQYHRQLPRRFEARRPGALHHGWRRAAPGYHLVEQQGGVTSWFSTRVWHVEASEHGVIAHTTGRHPGRVAAQTLVLSTGATERVLPFPGWDLPGVLTVGAAQALVKGQGVRPGHRVLLSGTGPLLLAGASTLLAAGTPVVEVVDANGPATWRRAGVGILSLRRSLEAAGHLKALAAARVPYRTTRAIVRVAGDGRVEQATTAAVDADWRPLPGTERTIAVDAVCVSHGFDPDVGIAAALGCALRGGAAPSVRVDALQRTSIARVFAAGETTGVAGAGVAALEGRIAGAAAARAAGHEPDRAAVRRDLRRLQGAQRFARSLARAVPIPDGWVETLEADTIVCRCEEVSRGDIERAVREAGARDVRSVKMATRCGMGRCQARMCGSNLVDLVRTATGGTPADADRLAARVIDEPVPLGEL